MKLTEQTARALHVSRLTVEAMRTPTVVVVDSGKVQTMQARIAELEQTVAEMTARETERVRRRTLLQDNTIAAGHPEFCVGPPVPILSLRGWFQNRQPVKPGPIRRWYLRLVFRPLKG